jgi:polyketide cyclase/dehydrase/lipid transport protein
MGSRSSLEPVEGTGHHGSGPLHRRAGPLALAGLAGTGGRLRFFKGEYGLSTGRGPCPNGAAMLSQGIPTTNRPGVTIMWKAEHTVEADATAAQVWARYVDLPSWREWYNDVSTIRVDGPFVSGATGVIEQDPEQGHHPQPVPFTLVDVVENEGFTLECLAPTSESGVADETFMRTHLRARDLGDGRVRITHSVILEGPQSEEVGAVIGEFLSTGLVSGLERLAKVVS